MLLNENIKDINVKNIIISMNPLDAICHRKPERSFHVKGHQFPVCARCTGFYISLIAYFIYAVYNYVDYSIYTTILACILLVPALVDGATQLFTNRESSNALRFATGLLGGLGLGILIKTLKFIIYLNGGL